MQHDTTIFLKLFQRSTFVGSALSFDLVVMTILVVMAMGNDNDDDGSDSDDGAIDNDGDKCLPLCS